ncbi:tRNA-dihydrouridine(16/17) synthase [NAD(P)(+)]-like protein, partial [Stegodyphus mimosarum]
MLENSGCSVLTVHGRTRKQKGHATGLASWDVIKEIKANVKIPVIANGNILSFDDIKNCLEYTGADAVMSAEGLLHNPALFTGENPPVWEIVDEYLKLAERYSTSIRCVRCHLFKILYLCLHQDDNVRQILAEGSSYSDFYKVCNVLKNLPSKILKEYDGDGDVFDYDLHKLSDNLFDAHENRSEFITNCSSKLTKTDCDILSNHFFSSDDSDGSDSDIENGKSCLSAERTLANEVKKKCILNLPVWLCHSRPRITDNEETRGSYSHYFNLPEKTDCTNEERGLSKKKLRKLRRHERVLAAMKEKRKLQKLRRKLKIAELKQNQAPETNDVPKERVTKKQQKLLIKERLLKAQGSSPKVCINLGFASEMEKKVEMSEKAPEELYETEDLIYLSPDAEDVLTTLDSSKVYVIGGIVDGTVKKGLSLNHAKNLHIKTVRLPVSEHLVKCSQNPGTTVLTVNQVFDILLKYHETKDWTEALSCNVPSRKGFCAPSDANRAKQRVLSNTEDILNPTEIHNES